MKKNISINLFGVLYNIDEDAYNLLDSYLQSMQRYFSRQAGGAEIADDIEHRVAELLWKRREAGMAAVDIEVVKDIIKTIGNPEEIADDGTSAAKDPKISRKVSDNSAMIPAGSHTTHTTEAKVTWPNAASIAAPTTRRWAVSARDSPLISMLATPSYGDLALLLSHCSCPSS